MNKTMTLNNKEMKIYSDILRFSRTGVISADIFQVAKDNIAEIRKAYECIKKHGYRYYFRENNLEVFTMYGDLQKPDSVTSWVVLKKI